MLLEIVTRICVVSWVLACFCSAYHHSNWVYKNITHALGVAMCCNIMQCAFHFKNASHHKSRVDITDASQHKTRTLTSIPWLKIGVATCCIALQCATTDFTTNTSQHKSRTSISISWLKIGAGIAAYCTVLQCVATKFTTNTFVKRIRLFFVLAFNLFSSTAVLPPWGSPCCQI